MRSLLTSIFLALAILLVPHTAHAATYPLTVTISSTGIAATMTSVPDTADKYKLQVLTLPFSSVAAQNTQNTVSFGTPADFIKSPVQGTVSWSISGLNPNNTYYIRVVKVDGVSPGIDEQVTTVQTFVNGAAGVGNDFYVWPLSVAGMTGQSAVLSGKIDTNLYPNVGGLEVRLDYSQSTSILGYKFAVAHSALGATSTEGVASDGSYYFELVDLQVKTTYYYRQTIKVKATGVVLSTKDLYFDSSGGYVPAGSAAEADKEAPYTYHLLAPWPGLSTLLDPALCQQKKAENKIPQNAVCDVNGFLNFAFKMMIGLTAVVLVLRLMYEGYQILVTDVPFLKASAKSGFFTALMGLILALSSYLILNTINPKLVNNSINVEGVNLSVQEFTLSNALSGNFSGPPIKVKFNTEAYPAALVASQKTGVDVAFILAIFSQETGGGRNLGACIWNTPGVMPGPVDKQTGHSTRDDQTPFQQIMQELGLAPASKAVSCPISGGGWGGGMGYTQFIPTTWIGFRTQAESFLGHRPSPWVLNDALMMTAVYLKQINGVNDPRNAACKYYSGRSCDNATPRNSFYGDQVMRRMESIKTQIADAKAKGEIQ